VDSFALTISILQLITAVTNAVTAGLVLLIAVALKTKQL